MNVPMKNEKNETTRVYDTNDIKLYKRRWFLLLLFTFYAASSTLHWSQFTSIADIVSRYYDVPRTLVEWTAVIMMAARAFLLFPSLFLLERLDTKYSLVLASTLCSIGSSIKCFSVSPNKFYIAFIGQIFSALSVTVTYSLVGRFSAAWFGSHEISRAGALSYAGDLVGSALSFLLPTRFVSDSANVEEVESGMRNMHYCYTTLAFTAAILITIFFESKPKRPPSAAQVHKRSITSLRVYESMKKLFRNPRFVLFVTAQAFLIGSGTNAVGTLLNEMIVTNYPGAGQHTGTIGCLSYLCGIAGSVIMCSILDRTRKFKLMAIILSMASCITFALFTVSLKLKSIIFVYVIYSIHGFCMNGYYGSTLQMGIELSFPIAEGITVAAMSVCIEVVSMITTILYGLAMKIYGDWRTNFCMTFLLFFSTIMISFVPPHFKREALERAAKSTEERGLLYGSESETSSISSETNSPMR